MEKKIDDVGLDISAIKTSELGAIVRPYLDKRFPKLFSWEGGSDIFQEVTQLDFEEIDHLIIQSKEYELFKDGDVFHGASGRLETGGHIGGITNDYTAILVMNGTQTRAYALYIQKWDSIIGSSTDILIKDFVNDPVKQTHKVEIREILSRTITIEADTELDALDKADEMYREEDIVLSADDFADIEIRIVKGSVDTQN